MKRKRILGLLLCVLLMVLLLPSTVFASETAGNGLSQYLDADGKFIIRTSCTDWTKDDVSAYVSRTTNGRYSVATQ